MNEDKLKALYNATAKQYNLGSYNDFAKKMQDANKRQAYFNAVSKSFNIGSNIDEFNKKLGVSGTEQKTASQQIASGTKSTNAVATDMGGGGMVENSPMFLAQQQQPSAPSFDLYKRTGNNGQLHLSDSQKAVKAENQSRETATYLDLMGVKSQKPTSVVNAQGIVQQPQQTDGQQIPYAVQDNSLASLQSWQKKNLEDGQPDYVWKTPRSHDEAEQFAAQAWTDNTEEGKQALADSQKKLNEAFNKTATELLQLHPELANDENALYDAVTQDSRFVEQQKQIEDGFRQQSSQANSHYLNSFDQHEGERISARSAKQLRDSIASLNKSFITRYGTSYVSDLDMENGIMTMPQDGYDSKMASIGLDAYHALLTADGISKDIEKTINGVRTDRMNKNTKGQGLINFGMGLKDGLLDTRNWASNLALDDAKSILKTIDKVKNNKELTPEEDKLMEALAIKAATDTYYADQLTRGYNAGQTTGASIPFMLEFMMTGAQGGADATGKCILKYAAKKWPQMLAKQATKKMLRVGADLAGAAVVSAAKTYTMDMPKVMGDAVTRMNGDAQYKLEDGKVKYNGQANQQGVAEAIWNSAVDNYTENLSEMIISPVTKQFGLGAVVKDLSKADNGVGKFMAKLNGTQLAKMMQRASNSQVYDWAHRNVGFDGLGEEFAEEEMGGLLKGIFTTDQKLSDTFNTDTQIDTFLGLVPTSLMFGAANAVQMGTQSAKSRREANRIIDGLREKGDNATADFISSLFEHRKDSNELRQTLQAYLTGKVDTKEKGYDAKWADLDEEDKANVLYGVYHTLRASMADDVKDAAKAMMENDARSQVTEQLEPNLHRESGNIITATAKDGAGNVHNYAIIGGNVNTTEKTDASGNKNTIFDTNNSDQLVTVRDMDDEDAKPFTMPLGQLDFGSIATQEDYIAAETARMMAVQNEEKTYNYNGHKYDTESGADLGEITPEQAEAESQETAVPKTVVSADGSSMFDIADHGDGTLTLSDRSGQEPDATISAKELSATLNTKGLRDMAEVAVVDPDGNVWLRSTDADGQITLTNLATKAQEHISEDALDARMQGEWSDDPESVKGALLTMSADETTAEETQGETPVQEEEAKEEVIDDENKPEPMQYSNGQQTINVRDNGNGTFSIDGDERTYDETQLGELMQMGGYKKVGADNEATATPPTQSTEAPTQAETESAPAQPEQAPIQQPKTQLQTDLEDVEAFAEQGDTEYLSSNLNEAKKKLKAAQTKMDFSKHPLKSTDKQKRMDEINQRKQNLAEAQAEVDRWQAVQDVLDKRANNEENALQQAYGVSLKAMENEGWTEELIKRANSDVPNGKLQLAINWCRGVKFDPDDLEKQTGERHLFVQKKKGGKTIDQLAHYIWENMEADERAMFNNDDMEIRDAIINALLVIGKGGAKETIKQLNYEAAAKEAAANKEVDDNGLHEIALDYHFDSIEDLIAYNEQLVAEIEKFDAETDVDSVKNAIFANELEQSENGQEANRQNQSGETEAADQGTAQADNGESGSNVSGQQLDTETVSTNSNGEQETESAEGAADDVLPDGGAEENGTARRVAEIQQLANQLLPQGAAKAVTFEQLIAQVPESARQAIQAQIDARGYDAVKDAVDAVTLPDGTILVNVESRSTQDNQQLSSILAHEFTHTKNNTADKEDVASAFGDNVDAMVDAIVELGGNRSFYERNLANRPRLAGDEVIAFAIEKLISIPSGNVDTILRGFGIPQDAINIIKRIYAENEQTYQSIRDYQGRSGNLVLSQREGTEESNGTDATAGLQRGQQDGLHNGSNQDVSGEVDNTKFTPEERTELIANGYSKKDIDKLEKLLRDEKNAAYQYPLSFLKRVINNIRTLLQLQTDLITKITRNHELIIYNKAVNERESQENVLIPSGKYSLVEISQYFKKLNSNKELTSLFNKVIKVAKKLNIDVEVTPIGTASGWYIHGLVQYDSKVFGSEEISNQSKAEIILHELIHSVTSESLYIYEFRDGNKKLVNGVYDSANGISSREIWNSLSNEQQKAIEDIHTIYGKVRYKYKGKSFISSGNNLREEYGLKSAHEFVAELSNSNFRAKLKKTNLWTRLVDAITSFFMDEKSGAEKSNVFKELNKAVNYILDNPPIDAINAELLRSSSAERERTERYAVPQAPSTPTTDLSKKEVVDLHEQQAKAKHDAEIGNGDTEGGVPFSVSTYATPILDENGNRTGWKDTFTDEDGNEHVGTRKMAIDACTASGMAPIDVVRFVNEMDYWYDFNVALGNFLNPDGTFQFRKFHEWNQRTPKYKMVGDKLEKALSSLVTNGEYPVNVELSTDCIKREAMTALFNAIADRGGSSFTAMNPKEIESIKKMMANYGVQVACPLCFVEGKRLGIRNWAQTIVDDWNKAVNEVLGMGHELETVRYQKPSGDKYDAQRVKDVDKMTEALGGFNFYTGGTLVSDQEIGKGSHDVAMTEDEREQMITINKVYAALTDRGYLQEADLETLTANQREYQEAIEEIENAWNNNPKKAKQGVWNPSRMTKAQLTKLETIANRGRKTVYDKMCGAIRKYPELRHTLNINDLIGSTGITALRESQGEAYARLYSLILSRFGTATPKVVQEAEPYAGDIQTLKKNDFDKANKIGGARLFSFSDFDLTKVFDIMQIFFDCASRNVKLQSYSKEVPYILLFGQTGAKINCSMLPEAVIDERLQVRIDAEKKDDIKKHIVNEYAGLKLDDNGNIVGFNWSGTHSITQEFAQWLYHNPKYNANCGAIAVGISVNHALHLCATDYIRQVIPFHLSGMPIASRQASDVKWYMDFTSMQNTGIGTKGKFSAIGSASSKNNYGSHPDFDFYAGDTMKEGDKDVPNPNWDIRQRCAEYIAWCDKGTETAKGKHLELRPRFWFGINSDTYKQWCKENDYEPNQQIIDEMDAATTTYTIDGKEYRVFDGYYKMIADFTCYQPEFDENGKTVGEKNAPHYAVTANITHDSETLDKVFGAHIDENGNTVVVGGESMLNNREQSMANQEKYGQEMAQKTIEFLNSDHTAADREKIETAGPGSVFKNQEDSKLWLESQEDNGGVAFHVSDSAETIKDAMDEQFALQRLTNFNESDSNAISIDESPFLNTLEDIGIHYNNAGVIAAVEKFKQIADELDMDVFDYKDELYEMLEHDIYKAIRDSENTAFHVSDDITPENYVEKAKELGGLSIPELADVFEMMNAFRIDKYGQNGRERIMSQVRSIGGAVTATRETLQESADIIRRFAKAAIRSGHFDDATVSEINSIVSNVANASTKIDQAREWNRIANIVLKAMADNAVGNIKKMLSMKLRGLSPNGVEIGKAVDNDTREMVETAQEALFPSGKNAVPETVKSLNDKIGEINGKLTDPDADITDAERKSIENQLDGLQLAVQYLTYVSDLQIDAQELERQIEADSKRGSGVTREQIDAERKSLIDLRQQIVDNADSIGSILFGNISRGRNEFLEAKKARKQRNQEILHGAFIDLEGRQTARDFREGEHGTFKDIVESAATFTGSLNHWLKKLAPNAAGGRGFLYDHFAYGIIKAREAEITGRNSAMDMLNRKAQEVFGIQKTKDAWVKAIDQHSSKLVPETEGTEWIDADTKTKGHTTLTQGQIMYIYMCNKMSDGRMKLMQMRFGKQKGNQRAEINKKYDGILLQASKDFEDGLIDEEELKQIKSEARENRKNEMQNLAEQIERDYNEEMEYLTSLLEPELREIADWLQSEFLPTLREKYNATHRRVFGIDMAKTENYVPLNINQNAVDLNLDLSESMMKMLPSTITGNLIKRTVNNKAIDIINVDGMARMMQYINDMEHWNAFVEMIQDANALMSNRTFRAKVMSYGKLGNVRIVENPFASLRSAFQIALGAYNDNPGSLDKTVSAITRGIVGSAIAFRLNTALKQLASAPCYLAQMDKKFYKNFGKSILPKNWVGNLQFCIENMPIFRERWESKTAGDEKLKFDSTKAKKWQRNIQEVLKTGNWPNAAVDLFTCALGAKAMYDTSYERYKELGYSEEVAHSRAVADAEIFFNESQQSGEQMFLSETQNSRSFIAGMFTAFKNSQIGYLRLTAEGVRTLNDARKEGGYDKMVELRLRQLEQQVKDGTLPLDINPFASDEEKQKEMREQLTPMAKADVDRELHVAVGKVLVYATFSNICFWMMGEGLKALWGGGDKNKDFTEPDESWMMRVLKFFGRAMYNGTKSSVSAIPVGNFLASIVDYFVKKSKGENTMLWNMFADSDIRIKELNDSIMDIVNSLPDKNGWDWMATVNSMLTVAARFGAKVDPKTLNNALYAIYDLGANGEFKDWYTIRQDLGMIVNATPTAIENGVLTIRDGESFNDFLGRYIQYKKFQNYGLMGAFESKQDYVNRMSKQQQTKLLKKAANAWNNNLK